MQVVRCTRQPMSTSSPHSSPATHPQHDHTHAPVPPRISGARGQRPNCVSGAGGAATHAASAGSSSLRQIVPSCSPTKRSVLCCNSSAEQECIAPGGVCSGMAAQAAASPFVPTSRCRRPPRGALCRVCIALSGGGLHRCVVRAHTQGGCAQVGRCGWAFRMSLRLAAAVSLSYSCRTHQAVKKCCTARRGAARGATCSSRAAGTAGQ